jgi:DNA-directed RNA polymerase subunit N (RpoN/RPB10)
VKNFILRVSTIAKGAKRNSIPETSLRYPPIGPQPKKVSEYQRWQSRIEKVRIVQKNVNIDIDNAETHQALGHDRLYCRKQLLAQQTRNFLLQVCLSITVKSTAKS